MGKEKIREYALELGADVVGFASIDDYENKGAVDPEKILPEVKSLVVLGYRGINGAVESENDRTMMASRMAEMDFSLKNNYLLSRYIEVEFGVKAASVPASYPMTMNPPGGIPAGDISLRHAAIAAGLFAQFVPERFAQRLIAVEAQFLRKPDHCRGLNAGPVRQLAH